MKKHITPLLTKSGNVNPNVNDPDWFVKKSLTPLLEWILQVTKNLPENLLITERVKCIKDKVFEVPTCDTPLCNKHTKWNTKTKSFAKHCSRQCTNKDIKVKEKIKNTCIENHGVDNYSKHPDFKKKAQATSYKKYGVSNPSQSQQIKDSIKNTFDNKYGGHPQRNAEIREKSQDTCNTRYGAPSPLESQTIANDIKESFNRKYGGDSPFCDPDVREKAKQTVVNKFGKTSATQSHIPDSVLSTLDDAREMQKMNQTHSLSQIGVELGVSKSTVSKRFQHHDITPILHHTSTFEDEVYAYLKSISEVDIIRNDRKLIQPHEIDLLIPAKKIAIECNGLYWHCELSGNKNKHYHLNKTAQAEKHGYHLVQITDLEWNQKQPIVKSRLASLLGLNNRLYARKTKIQEVSYQDAKHFLVENHIQGDCSSSVRLGLYMHSQLCALMTFGKPRYNKKAQWELLRYCSLREHNVIGGASKLLNHFEKTYQPQSLLSYSDRAWNTGNLYKSLGFDFVENSPPNYYYLDKHIMKLFHRSVFQKHKLPKLLENVDMTRTEWENMQAHGFDRYWNCGNSVWLKGNTK